MKKVKVGIAGAAGYTGGELIRILISHPGVELSCMLSRSQAGKKISTVHTDLSGDTDLIFTDTLLTDIDVLFLCMGHGESKKFLESGPGEHTRIIDLSNDFRLVADSVEGKRTFVYGLPELNRDKIRIAQNIANPGCFATAIQLALLPLANSHLLSDIYTTGITGSTGAGQTPVGTSHFSWRANNIQAYKTLTHQHLGEIYQSLHQLQDSFPAKNKTRESHPGGSIHFVPWRGDFTRGIFVSSQLKCSHSLQELEGIYKEFYKNEPFTHISSDPIHLKQVVNTNKCLLQLEMQDDNLVVHSVLDNLLKGASGQAVQNMNIMFGLEESTGLKLKANYF